MTRSLIYYVSLGGFEYYSNTAKSIETLIKNGYKEEVIVLSDVDVFPIILPNNVRTINCKTIIHDRVEKTTGIYSFRYYRNAKGFICECVDMDLYDVILYLDSDVLINKPINTTLDSCAKENAILIQKDSTKVKRGKTRDTNGGKVLDDEGISYLSGYGFCSGVICVSKIHFDLFRVWHEKNILELFTKSDQGNLHWSIWKLQLLQHIKYLDAYPVKGRDDNKALLHYWQKNTQGFDEKYKEIMGAERQGPSGCTP